MYSSGYLVLWPKDSNAAREDHLFDIELTGNLEDIHRSVTIHPRGQWRILSADDGGRVDNLLHVILFAHFIYLIGIRNISCNNNYFLRTCNTPRTSSKSF